jgi:ribosomal protein S21
MEIEVRNGDIDGALITLKKRLARDGILVEVRQRSFGFDPPGVKRRKKHRKYLARMKRRMEER